MDVLFKLEEIVPEFTKLQLLSWLLLLQMGFLLVALVLATIVESLV